jgi:hypothetical protein
MSDRYRTKDGWSVEIVRLVCTPDHHDGEWLRICYFGYHVRDVRSVSELERYFPLADLEPEALAGVSIGTPAPVLSQRARGRDLALGQPGSRGRRRRPWFWLPLCAARR